MKKWIFMLGLILLIGGNSCWATAIVQTTDYISFPVVALDSATGVEAVPESVHIHVWRGSLTNTTVYSFRETGDGADLAQIDSVATGYAGAVPQQYYFHDKVEDIDGDGTAGVYTINVRLWRGRTATSNWFSFQILTNSFNDAITAATVLLDDSLGGLKNSLTKAFDGDTTWGTNPILSLERVFVRPEVTHTDAVLLRATGTGNGINSIGQYGIRGYGSQVGIFALGDVSGMHMVGTASYGLYVLGGDHGIISTGDSSGMTLEGSITNDLVLDGSGHISGWMDSVKYVESVSDQVTAIQAYLGAGHDWRQHLMPFASANNDSVRTFDGADCVATIYLWKDDSDATVLDSITMKEW